MTKIFEMSVSVQITETVMDTICDSGDTLILCIEAVEKALA